LKILSTNQLAVKSKYNVLLYNKQLHFLKIQKIYCKPKEKVAETAEWNDDSSSVQMIIIN